MKAYSVIQFVAFLFQFRIFRFTYFSLKESIEPRESICDLKLVEAQLYQFAFKLRFHGLGFDATMTTPIKIVKIIGNFKPMKHRSYESQSPNLFLFLCIYLHT